MNMAAMQLSSTASCGLFRAFPESRAPPRTPAVVIGRKHSRVIFASSVNNHSKVIITYTHIKQIDASSVTS